MECVNYQLTSWNFDHNIDNEPCQTFAVLHIVSFRVLLSYWSLVAIMDFSHFSIDFSITMIPFSTLAFSSFNFMLQLVSLLPFQVKQVSSDCQLLVLFFIGKYWIPFVFYYRSFNIPTYVDQYRFQQIICCKFNKESSECLSLNFLYHLIKSFKIHWNFIGEVVLLVS